jgi:hypothetical protein
MGCIFLTICKTSNGKCILCANSNSIKLWSYFDFVMGEKEYLLIDINKAELYKNKNFSQQRTEIKKTFKWMSFKS